MGDDDKGRDVSLPSSCTTKVFSSAGYWLEFLPAESLAVCQCVCSALLEAAREDRLWKEACLRRWTKVNVSSAGHQRSYASLNGWRKPRFRRTILCTAPPWRTRSSHPMVNSNETRNISAMDVGPSKVVVCAADTAWYYRVSSLSNDDDGDGIEGGSLRDTRNDGGNNEAPTALERERQNYGNTDRIETDGANGDNNERERPLWGCRLDRWNVTEARFPADERRCFFGTVSGKIFMHEGVDAAVEGDSSRRQRRPIVCNTLTSADGTPIAVRQIVATFEGGTSAGAKLGVLCRPPAGWQPNLAGAGSGGYLVIADTRAESSARTMCLSDGSLAGGKFPSMARGGAAVSVAPAGSSCCRLPLAGEEVSGSAAEVFAVGFSGGSVALLDGRCGERGGVIGGFVTMHRWLERIRCAGSLLMASYGRCSNIETWDLRRLPSAAGSRDCAVSPPPPPHRVADLSCSSSKAPDFWVEPHGLTVAVYGAPRNSQRFGAKHSFFDWPRFTANGSLLVDKLDRQSVQLQSSSSASPSLLSQRKHLDPLNFTRTEGSSLEMGAGSTTSGRRGVRSGHTDMRSLESGGVGDGNAWGEAGEEGDICTRALEKCVENSRARALQDFASAGVGVPRRVGFEVITAGVVSDSDYRLRLSTGIKFCDTHMATVIDNKRVLVDEVDVSGYAAATAASAGRGSVGRTGVGVRDVYLSAECLEMNMTL